MGDLADVTKTTPEVTDSITQSLYNQEYVCNSFTNSPEQLGPSIVMVLVI